MTVLETPLPDARLIELDRHDDERGWFMELWNEPRYRDAGFPPLVQTNVSRSGRGVLRGMHFQSPAQQGKLVAVLQGTIHDVIVDVRLGSPTFGRWFGCELSDANRRQLWVPEGFAHGFLALSEPALVCYGCTRVYDASAERTIAWNDPDIGVAWTETPRSVSPRDARAPCLADLPREQLPVYHG